MSKGISKLLKQNEVPGGYDRARYQVERIFAMASDGVKIPISVVHLNGTKLDSKGPIYLTGYGSYGFPYDIRFDSNRFSMVDRGVVVGWSWRWPIFAAVGRWGRRGTMTAA